VLLHLFAALRLRHPIKLRALHVNHSLSPHATDWLAHCQTVCKNLQIELLHDTIQARAAIGESPEEVARQKRYAMLSTHLASGDVLLTAHHQDDQAETMLLQMLRGAGPKGLSAMPRVKPLGQGFHARPLLDFSREDLTAYANEKQLSWINDESNENSDFSRNFIRHQITPVLKKRWPKMTTTLARVSLHCAEAQQLLDEMASQDLMTVRGKKPNTLSVSQLQTLSAMRQRQVLRYWLSALNLPLPSEVKIQQAQKDMLTARLDKSPSVTWKGGVLKRYQDDLYALPAMQQPDVNQVLAWDLQQPLVIAGVGVLQSTPAVGSGLRANLSNVTVRFRRGGESCQLPGRHCTHRLKKIFQENHIPPWERGGDSADLCGRYVGCGGGVVCRAGVFGESRRAWIFVKGLN